MIAQVKGFKGPYIDSLSKDVNAFLLTIDSKRIIDIKYDSVYEACQNRIIYSAFIIFNNSES